MVKQRFDTLEARLGVSAPKAGDNGLHVPRSFGCGTNGGQQPSNEESRWRQEPEQAAPHLVGGEESQELNPDLGFHDIIAAALQEEKETLSKSPKRFLTHIR